MAGQASGTDRGTASAAAAIACAGGATLVAACVVLAAVALGRFIGKPDNARAIGLLQEPPRWIVELEPAALGTRLMPEALSAVSAADCLADGTVAIGGSERLSMVRVIADAFAAAGRQDEMRRRMAAYLGERVFVVLPSGQVRRLQPPAEQFSISALAVRPGGSAVAVGGNIIVDGDDGQQEAAVYVAEAQGGWERVEGVEGWWISRLVWAGEELFAVVQVERRGQVRRIYARRAGEFRQVGQIRCDAIIWAGAGPRGLVLLVRRDGRLEWAQAEAGGHIAIAPAREAAVAPGRAVACRIDRWVALVDPQTRAVQKLWKPDDEACRVLRVAGPSGRWVFVQASVKGGSDWLLAYDMARRGLVKVAKLAQWKWSLLGMRGANRLVLSAWQEGTFDEPVGRCDVWDVRVDREALKRQTAARAVRELGILPKRAQGKSGGK